MRDRILAEAKAAMRRNDSERVVSVLTPLAEAGDAEAQYLLGSLYIEGTGMPASAAYEWLKKAADQNHAEACYLLSCLTCLGDKTDDELRALLLRAAELGSVSAQCALGTYYATGDWSGPQDFVEAAKWYGRAASTGDADAQYELGFMLLLGEGVEKDFRKAVNLIQEAAKQGHEDSILLLGDIYEKGSYGGEKNAELAAYWREKAAKSK